MYHFKLIWTDSLCMFLSWVGPYLWLFVIFVNFHGGHFGFDLIWGISPSQTLVNLCIFHVEIPKSQDPLRNLFLQFFGTSMKIYLLTTDRLVMCAYTQMNFGIYATLPQFNIVYLLAMSCAKGAAYCHGNGSLWHVRVMVACDMSG